MRPKLDEFRPSNEELNTLRTAGLTRVQIAVKYDVPLSRVKRWLRELDVAPRANKVIHSKPKIRIREKQRYGSFDDDSLMEKAKAVLGDRMGEKRHIGYTLDGRPVSSWQIAQAAKIPVRTRA